MGYDLHAQRPRVTGSALTTITGEGKLADGGQCGAVARAKFEE